VGAAPMSELPRTHPIHFTQAERDALFAGVALMMGHIDVDKLTVAVPHALARMGIGAKYGQGWVSAYMKWLGIDGTPPP
jgi:hypothetical protein